MMRRPLTTLTLVATCGLLALGTAAAVTVESAGSATSATHGAAAGAPTRTSRLSMSPRPDDLALAEISFHTAGHALLSRHSLQVAVSGSFGDDYLASAALRGAASKGPTVLVLLVNRPSPLLDPANVGLRITMRRALGAPTVRMLADPFTHPAGDSTPALCGLRRGGAALTGSELSVLGARGTALAGFTAASAVAQADDVACRLPYRSSFKQAVEQASPEPTPPTAPGPVSPSPPAPSPPVGKLPGEGCRPSPGRACPGAVRNVVPGVSRDGARRSAAAAH